jgi:uncharacterized protein
MPDPLYARESVWVPFIVDALCGGADSTRGSVVVGHSSGAAAALRLAEAHELAGLVLVAAYDSDLGDELERNSGYFSRPFDWAAIVKHCGFIVQFAGAEDSLVPIQVQRRVAEHITAAAAAAGLPPSQTRYIEVTGEDHFFDYAGFPAQLVESIKAGLSLKVK